MENIIQSAENIPLALYTFYWSTRYNSPFTYIVAWRISTPPFLKISPFWKSRSPRKTALFLTHISYFKQNIPLNVAKSRVVSPLVDENTLSHVWIAIRTLINSEKLIDSHRKLNKSCKFSHCANAFIRFSTLPFFSTPPFIRHFSPTPFPQWHKKPSFSRGKKSLLLLKNRANSFLSFGKKHFHD